MRDKKPLIRSVCVAMVIACLLLSGSSRAFGGTADPSLAIVKGTVKNADGTPAKGLQVQLVSASGARKKPGDKRDDGKHDLSTTTLEDGTFVCKDVPLGAYRVVAGSPRTGTGLATVRAESAGAYSVTITIRPPREPKE